MSKAITMQTVTISKTLGCEVLTRDESRAVAIPALRCDRANLIVRNGRHLWPGRGRRTQFVVHRRLDAREITDEVVPTAARHIVAGVAITMPLVRQHQQIEVF